MEKKKLIEIWQALESLVVSIDRIGSYEVDNGKEAALKALDSYFVPENCNKIAHARMLINELIETEFPGTDKELEEMAENEKLIGFWQYPRKSNA
jgi:hypothetical protein